MEENKITVVQALDERDMLVKRITSRIQKAQFADIIRPRAQTTWEARMTKAAFEAQAQSALQQIEDLIVRYDALNAAITVSNATTYLDTSRGRMPVSCAIALRNRLRGNGPYGELTDFEGRLSKRMEAVCKGEQEKLRRKNDAIRRETPAPKNEGIDPGKVVPLQAKGTAGKSTDAASRMERSKRPQERSMDLYRMVDPLDLRRKSEEITERREELLAELETKIKISNATTYLTI